MEIEEIKRIVKFAFSTSLGQQVYELFTCSDGKIFIRFSEALLHSTGELDPHTKPLQDKTILGWAYELNPITNQEELIYEPYK